MLAAATPGLSLMLEASQACVSCRPPVLCPPPHLGLEEVNSLEPYGDDARGAGPVTAAASGPTPGGGRVAQLPLPREQRPAGGEGACYMPTFISRPGTSDVGPPHPLGATCSKGCFSQISLPQNLRCHAGQPSQAVGLPLLLSQ